MHIRAALGAEFEKVGCYILVLDNPRTTAYNKDKERRYPCKRLAPHQSSITKVMTATGLGVLGGHFFLCFSLLLP